MRLIAILCLPLLILSSCASYKASSLNNLSSAIITTSSNKEPVVIVAKAFDKNDCKRHLDRDVLAEGYQPVQLFIQNNSNSNYNFSLDKISLPCARAEEVAQTVHTSTVQRVVWYSAGALILSPLFAIPAVIDGIKSKNANEALDNDFAAKTAKNQVIHSYSTLNKLIFVPVAEYQEGFTVTLVDMDSNKPKILSAIAE